MSAAVSLSASLSLSLSFLSCTQDFGLRAHAYANAGNLLPLQKVGAEFVKTWRGAWGVGLALGTNFGRIEVNYNLWHRNQDYDQTAPGLQWGLGLEFL